LKYCRFQILCWVIHYVKQQH